MAHEDVKAIEFSLDTIGFLLESVNEGCEISESIQKIESSTVSVVNTLRILTDSEKSLIKHRVSKMATRVWDARDGLDQGQTLRLRKISLAFLAAKRWSR